MIDRKARLAAALAGACSLAALAAAHGESPQDPVTGGSTEAVAPAAAEALASLASLEVLRLDVPREPRAFRSSLVIGTTPMTLDLAPHSVRSRSFRVLVQEEGGELVTRDPGPVTTLRGSILEVPGSRAVGRLVEGELEALVFLPGRRVLQIEPASRYVPDAERELYAAYRCDGGPDALTGGEELDCGVVSEPQIGGGPELYLSNRGGVQDCAALGTCVAELLCDTDFSLYTALGSDPLAVQSFVEYAVAVANERFNDYVPDLDILHDISDVVIRTDPGSDPYAGSADRSDLLSRLHQEWNNPPIHTSDLVHLFTNQHPGGLAHIASVCNYSNMEGVSGGATSTCSRGVLLAHELGHNWGSHHVLTGIMRQFGGSCGSTWDGCISSSCEPTCCAPTWIMQRRDQVDSVCLDLLLDNTPPVAVDDHLWGPPETGLSFQVHDLVANDLDADPGDTVRFNAFESQPEHGTLTYFWWNGEDTIWNYIPDPPGTLSLKAGGYFVGVDSFTYSVMDDQGAVSEATVFLALEHRIFADAFESAGTSAWTQETTAGGGTLAVTGAAALEGSFGLAAGLAGAGSQAYVEDASPIDESRYRARFLLSADAASTSPGDVLTIFQAAQSPGGLVAFVRLRHTASGREIAAIARDDSGGYSFTSWHPLPSGTATVELDWQAASGAGANDGSLTLWLDGEEVDGITGLDTEERRVDLARLGAVNNVAGTASGTLYFDAFESRRLTYIGPVQE